ncbi:MAG: TrkA family potassium uptake protein [Thermaerobacter sp.]|nr:TrkA family potassium uptake protein [Thermaerobacter sp.]MDA8146227.1 TrkA family potassium uptake protein [Thermaerobacter sp.]
MYVIVVGCGRLGAAVAQELAGEGHQVAVVDRRAESLERLGRDAQVQRIVGTGIDIDVLRQAGIDRAEAVAALTDLDNANIMIAQTAQQIFQVPRVVARVNDLRVESVFQALGVPTVCPTRLAVLPVKEQLLAGGGA